MEKNNQSPRISVIIPTWNRRDLALRCLGSLAEQSFRDFETIVVDDGSTDDTVAAVGRDYPEATVVEMGENRRFAAAVNAGIASARGEWIFLLNNDVTLEKECLERLLAGAAGAEADMVAPLILWQDEPERIYSAGDRVGIHGRPEAIGFRALRADFQIPHTIFGVSAAAGLYRRAIFMTVGLLDPSFVAYFEDADLCFRARLAGFDAALVPEAVAYHIGSASIEGQTWWRSAQCFRNHGLLLIKNMPATLIRRHFFAIVRERLHQLACAFSSSRCAFGALKAVAVTFWALGGFLARVPGAFVARRRIQRNRVLSAEAVEALLWRGGDDE